MADDDNVDKMTPGAQRNVASKLKLGISEGFKNLGRVVNKKISWTKLCERLSEPVKDNITTDEYERLPQRDRHDRKNHGWIVGGQFTDGKRKRSNIEHRSLLTFDLDELSMKLYSELIEPLDGFLSDFEHFVYTTRSHKPNKPRVRVVIPLTSQITRAEFGPLSRIVAFRINPEMDQIDPVSYRITQLMFLPNVSSDGEFRHNWHRGELLDPEMILNGWDEDWRDYSRLPRSPREAAKLRDPGKTVGDPREKRGIIGAWCRAHSISDVIEQWWSDRYVPGDQTADGTERYTFVQGSTTNGVLVFKDLHAYSFQTTDPISGLLVNSWDFDRLNRFGHLDRDDTVEDSDGDPRRLPSYRAMEEFALGDRETQIELQKANYDLEAMADDLVTELEPDEDRTVPSPGSIVEERTAATVAKPSRETETGDGKEWVAELELSDRGVVRSTVHNVVVILENDPRFAGAFAYNEFTARPALVRRIRSRALKHDTGPIRDKDNGDPLIDVDVAIARCIIEAPRGEGRYGWGLSVSRHNMTEAVDVVCKRNGFHPVRRYLQSLEWDGVPRLRKLLSRYWHVPNTPYHAEVGSTMLVGAVARVFEPGHKWDYMVIFRGPQGIGKSTAVELLPGRSWFREFHLSIHRDNRQIVETIKGSWFVELPELAAFMDDRHSVETMKALFSTQSDSTRLAYRRNEEIFPRQNIFIGTTNNQEYLRDPTGNRRFWIVALGKHMIDLRGLRRDRDQIWAEAYEEYCAWREEPEYSDTKHPLPLNLSPLSQMAADKLAGLSMQSTGRETRAGQIEAWLEQPVPASQAKAGWRPDGGDGDEPPDDEPLVLREHVCVGDITFHLFGLADKDLGLSREIGAIMSDMEGWTRDEQPRWCGKLGTQRIWVRTDKSGDDEL